MVILKKLEGDFLHKKVTSTIQGSFQTRETGKWTDNDVQKLFRKGKFQCRERRFLQGNVIQLF